MVVCYRVPGPPPTRTGRGRATPPPGTTRTRGGGQTRVRGFFTLQTLLTSRVFSPNPHVQIYYVHQEQIYWKRCTCREKESNFKLVITDSITPTVSLDVNANTFISDVTLLNHRSSGGRLSDKCIFGVHSRLLKPVGRDFPRNFGQ